MKNGRDGITNTKEFSQTLHDRKHQNSKILISYLSIRAAVFTVSPNNWKRAFSPIRTPPVTGPLCNPIRIHKSKNRNIVGTKRGTEEVEMLGNK